MLLSKHIEEHDCFLDLLEVELEDHSLNIEVEVLQEVQDQDEELQNKSNWIQNPISILQLTKTKMYFDIINQDLIKRKARWLIYPGDYWDQ